MHNVVVLMSCESLSRCVLRNSGSWNCDSPYNECMKEQTLWLRSGRSTSGKIPVHIVELGVMLHVKEGKRLITGISDLDPNPLFKAYPSLLLNPILNASFPFLDGVASEPYPLRAL